jgi:Fe-S-cluster-containing dehydrogenase component/DMSO reductase anchor subunit
MRKGFIFDLNKCVGCEACVVACQIENHDAQSAAWRSINTYNSFQHPALPLFHFSLACNHCDDPLCLTGCPTNAFTMDPLYHTVDHHQDLCIGCRYCTWTCPYDAPKYVNAKGVIEKCTLCKERIVEGRKPNCANLCPTGALDFGDIETKVAFDVPGFTDKGIWPGIRVIPLRKKGRPLAAVQTLTENEGEFFKRAQFKDQRKSTLKSEWPLVLFTLLVAFLFAVTAAALLQAPLLDPLTYIALGVGGMIVSTMHLGMAVSAWRALLNVQSSWLSREIVAYSLFLCSSSFFLLASPMSSIGIFSTSLGLVTLISIDMVYARVEHRSTPIEKSGSVVLTGVLFFAVLVQMLPLFIAILAGKCVLYVSELSKTRRRTFPRQLASGVRIAVGFVLPALLLVVQGDILPVAISIFIGEAINRVEFYLDLNILTPRKQIEIDILKELSDVEVRLLH